MVSSSLLLNIRRYRAQYLVVMLAVAQVAMTASTYLITFAAIERYCASVDSWAVAHLQVFQLEGSVNLIFRGIDLFSPSLQ